MFHCSPTFLALSWLRLQATASALEVVWYRATEDTPPTVKISATLALAVIASINAEVAMARCYKWGWGTPTQAKGCVDFACRGNGGMFTGNFAPGWTKSMCPKSGSLGTSFEVQNQNTNQGFEFGDDYCGC
ncbi:hypothetical protein MBLNU13_g09710t1 [Cladosporium sp. NU13]